MVQAVRMVHTVRTVQAVRMVHTVRTVQAVRMVHTVRTVEAVPMVHTVRTVQAVRTIFVFKLGPYFCKHGEGKRRRSSLHPISKFLQNVGNSATSTASFIHP